MRARDHERVAARRRVDVHEGDRALVLVDDRRGQLARDDLAEEAVPGSRDELRTCSGWERESEARPEHVPTGSLRTVVPDRRHLRDAIAHLAAIDRPSASPGEREPRSGSPHSCASSAAPSRVEEERAHGGYWFPLGVPNALAGLAGLLARRGGRAARAAAMAIGAFAAAAIWDDVGGGRLWFRRRFLPRRPTWNVVAETGDPPRRAHARVRRPPRRGALGPALPPGRAAVRRTATSPACSSAATPRRR